MQCCGIFCHKIKRATLHALMHRSKGYVVVRWLTRNISKPFSRKVSVKDEKLAMVVTAQAGVVEDGYAHVIKRKLCVLRP
jgi:hypothetical protein